MLAKHVMIRNKNTKDNFDGQSIISVASFWWSCSSSKYKNFKRTTSIMTFVDDTILVYNTMSRPCWVVSWQFWFWPTRNVKVALFPRPTCKTLSQFLIFLQHVTYSGISIFVVTHRNGLLLDFYQIFLKQ